MRGSILQNEISEKHISITLNGLQLGIMLETDAIYIACRLQEVGNGHTRSWQSLITTYVI